MDLAKYCVDAVVVEGTLGAGGGGGDGAFEVLGAASRTLYRLGGEAAIALAGRRPWCRTNDAQGAGYVSPEVVPVPVLRPYSGLPQREPESPELAPEAALLTSLVSVYFGVHGISLSLRHADKPTETGAPNPTGG